MQKDTYNHVWLKLRSDHLAIEDIEVAVKLESNVGYFLKQRPGLPQRKRKAFSIQSDRELDKSLPIENHIAWMVDRCKQSASHITEFIRHKGNDGDILIYIQTNSDSLFYSLDPASMKFFAEVGLSVEFKVDFYGEHENNFDNQEL